MTWDSGQQVIRKLGDILGGVLLSMGVLNADGVTMLIGAGVSVASFGWWFYWNMYRKDVSSV